MKGQGRFGSHGKHPGERVQGKSRPVGWFGSGCGMHWWEKLSGKWARKREEFQVTWLGAWHSGWRCLDPG